jgi:hypothetical protein
MAGRRVEGSFNQGWGIALFICVLTAACFAGAFAIHQRTFRAPTDVLSERVPGTQSQH